MEIPGYRIEDQVAEGGMATVFVAIQESLVIMHGEDSFMPDPRMDIQALAAVAPECNHLVRCNVISGQGDRYNEGQFIQRKE